MHADVSTRNSMRSPLVRWGLRFLIALVLVVCYAFCFFIVPKIEARWTSPGPEGCALELLPAVPRASDIRRSGYSLIVVAREDQCLHFRIFDGRGKMVVDTDEKKLSAQTQQIDSLRKQLENLWPPQNPTRSERISVNASVTSIVGYAWSQVPWLVNVIVECSFLFMKYGPAVVLALIVIPPLRRGYRTIKPKLRRRQISLTAVMGMIAVCALVLGVFHAFRARLIAPYQAEQRAAAALRRLGGTIVMGDAAPKWLRPIISKEMLNMGFVEIIVLSHTQVSDADLMHLKSLRYCLDLNLSDTQISNAGLDQVGGTVHQRLDLSRTRVTDVSRLPGFPATVRLSGNRIARVEFGPGRWGPLQTLDLSDTDVDDRTLAALPDHLHNLADLDLSGTRVSDDGVMSLLKVNGLRKLNLADTQVTAAGLARLKSQWRHPWPLTVVTGTRKKPSSAPASKLATPMR
jgi:Leucine Rich repeat